MKQWLGSLWDELKRVPAVIAFHTFTVTVVVLVLVLSGGSPLSGLFAGALLLLGQELGQAKYIIPGSVKTPEKRKAMFLHLCSGPIVAQWGIPVLIVELMHLGLGLVF